MTTYTWSIQKMSVMPVLEGKTDVVVSVQWEILGKDQWASYSLLGLQNLNLNQSEDFTPYDQVSESQVICWVKDAMGDAQVVQMEDIVQNVLNEMLNPPIEPISQPLPWAQ